ncbi:MFS transporter [Saccharothrix mutabilis subsp. mutabilis]|uniref:MFS transporter n=1 Tax=Saccharothrix mutabilis subsp. mutabilis TaxID=66855 RepID=A0ABN0U5G1_9PSEU
MNLAPYLAVLRTPRVPSFLVLMLFARIPATAAGMTITMHVLLGLERGYGAAGLVGAMSTIGIALGSPLMGRLTDRRGLRAMLSLSLVVEGVFWFVAPALPFGALLVTCFLAGIATMPVMSLGRQITTALVGESGRRTALALDSMAVEVAFMGGPALGVFLTTHWGSRVAMWTIGALLVLFGLVLAAVDPPVSSTSGERAPRREWLTRRLAGVLISAGGATFVLSGVEVAVVAAMRDLGLTDWIGAVVVVMCVGSLVGGFVYGGVRTAPPVWVMMGAMGLLAVPVGLFTGSVWALVLALVPTNFLCAPTIAGTGDAIAELTPGNARGEALGLQGSAFTLGAALGAPLTGWVIDHSAPGWGFFVAGVGAVAIAAASLVLGRERSAQLV